MSDLHNCLQLGRVMQFAYAGLLHKWTDADLPTLKRLGSGGPNNPLAQLTWRLNLGPDINVTATPLAHRLPCWGYVFQVSSWDLRSVQF